MYCHMLRQCPVATNAPLIKYGGIAILVKK